MKKRIIVIGSGLAGMSSATYLAKEGYEVKVIEKNKTYGGRLQTYKENGFTFDLGPSWYWMPDLFESFFSDFGKKVSDYYSLTRLDPGYRIYFEDREFFDVPENYEKLKNNLDHSDIQLEGGFGRIHRRHRRRICQQNYQNPSICNRRYG